MKRRRLVLSLGCALAITASAACNEPATTESAATPPVTGDRAAATTGDAGRVRVADLTGNPAGYAGRTVTVEADVEEVLGPRAFKLDEDAALAGGVDNDLLVISPKAGSLADIDDQWLNNRVRVTGKVGKWTVIEVEKEIGWDLDTKLEAEVERVGAVLIASSVNRLEKQ